MSPIGSSLSSKIFTRIFQYSGIWFPEPRSVWYLLYAFVLYTGLTVQLWIYSIMYILEAEDTADIITAAYMFIFISSFLLKSTTFIYYNKRIQGLVKELQSFELHDENEQKLVDGKLRSFLRPLIMFLVVTEFCATMFAIKSIFQEIPELPCPCFHPLDWKNDTLFYWLAWPHIFLAIQLSITANVGVQLYYSYLMFFISVLMEVLGLRLSKLNYKATPSDKCMSEQSLTDCIKMHKHILNALDEYKACFATNLLFDVCSTSLGVCSEVYQFVMVSTDLPTQVFLVTIFLVQIGQIYIPCYFGNEIILQSNALINHVYFSNWTEMTQSSKRSIIIFMERLKRETQIVVGKLFPLSLETFTTICVQSHRFFAVLQSLAE